MSQYDLIGKNYSDMIRVDPVKIFVQRPSAVKLLKPKKEQLVLDIGCGDGIISRLIAKEGANVVGIDPSERQIGVAQVFEKKEPLGIKYFVSQIQEFSFPIKFDSALAVMVLCYANNMQGLQILFDSVFSSLKKGGRFVIVDWDKDKLPFEREYYGRFCKHLPNGKILVEWNNLGIENFSAEVTYFSKEEFERCAKKAGFKDIVFSNLGPTDEGLLKMGKEFWKRFNEEPVWFGLTMEK